MANSKSKYKDRLTADISDIFLKFGLRSTSMDDIASNLKISKKTLYQFFSNKEDVVEHVLIYRMKKRDKETTPEELYKKNPIEIFFDIKAFILRDIERQYPSNYYDIRKYYPEVYHKMKGEDEAFTTRFINSLMQEGISKGFFRRDIDTPLQIYLFGKQLSFLKDPENMVDYPYPLSAIISVIIDNFLLIVSTEKGITEIKRLQNNDL